MNLDDPIPPHKELVHFSNGSLAGSAVMVETDCHHWGTSTEYYQRENYTTPEDPRTLISRFVLVTEGYRARGDGLRTL